MQFLVVLCCDGSIEECFRWALLGRRCMVWTVCCIVTAPMALPSLSAGVHRWALEDRTWWSWDMTMVMEGPFDERCFKMQWVECAFHLGGESFLIV